MIKSFLCAIEKFTFSQSVCLILILSSICAVNFGKFFSYRTILISLIIISSLILLLLLFFLLRPNGMHVSLYFISIFIASFLYASYKNVTFPFPYERSVEINIKILSDPEIIGRNVQYVGKINRSKDKNLTLPHSKVMLQVPVSRELPKRGDLIYVKGLFMELPFDKSKDPGSPIECTVYSSIFNPAFR